MLMWEKKTDPKISDLSFHFKKLEEEQIKPKLNFKKQIKG